MKKVYLNVEESDIFYRFQNYKFYFSSEATRDRYIRKLEEYIKAETDKFIIKYGILVEKESFYISFAFILYSKTEKRGFKVEEYNDNIKMRDIKSLPIFAIWGEIKND